MLKGILHLLPILLKATSLYLIEIWIIAYFIVIISLLFLKGNNCEIFTDVFRWKYFWVRNFRNDWCNKSNARGSALVYSFAAYGTMFLCTLACDLCSNGGSFHVPCCDCYDFSAQSPIFRQVISPSCLSIKFPSITKENISGFLMNWLPMSSDLGRRVLGSRYFVNKLHCSLTGRLRSRLRTWILILNREANLELCGTKSSRYSERRELVKKVKWLTI